MEKDLEKRENYDLTKGKFPEEMKPFEKGVGPAVAVGKAAGNFVSDLIDGIVDLFCDDDNEKKEQAS
jgi:hypothetical protein